MGSWVCHRDCGPKESNFVVTKWPEEEDERQEKNKNKQGKVIVNSK
jgi:hypothetical protein